MISGHGPPFLSITFPSLPYGMTEASLRFMPCDGGRGGIAPQLAPFQLNSQLWRLLLKKDNLDCKYSPQIQYMFCSGWTCWDPPKLICSDGCCSSTVGLSEVPLTPMLCNVWIAGVSPDPMPCCIWVASISPIPCIEVVGLLRSSFAVVGLLKSSKSHVLQHLDCQCLPQSNALH